MFLIPASFWKIRKTKNKGRGVFARKPIRQGALIGDYVGKLVQLLDFDFDKEKRELYLMYYNDELGIYPDLKISGVHLLNHSCSPNCWIIKYKNHTVVFALKNIRKGSELTISYLLPPKMNCNPCPHRCFCKSKKCTGSMHLTESGYKKWQAFQDKHKRGMSKTNRNAGELELLKKYPKSFSKKLISEIKVLQKEMHK
ncbi:MAG TPA: SET domain-containing protein [Patescibacteria group bacterium]|nr:SET domain-containing protein [Patescibacteria group bacterium]